RAIAEQAASTSARPVAPPELAPPLPVLRLQPERPQIERTIAFSALAAGLTSLAAGTVTWLVANDRRQQADDLSKSMALGPGTQCPNGGGFTDHEADCRRLHALREDASVLSTVGSSLALAGSAIGVVAAAYLVLRPAVGGAGPGGPRLAIGVSPNG